MACNATRPTGEGAGWERPRRARSPLFFLLVAVCLSTVTGCVTKSKARSQAQQAYIAGQQQAMALMKQSGNTVYISGDVQNPIVEWKEGMTLAQGILAADYRGARDPREIRIYRDGQIFSIDPRQLLRGHDELLKPGDRIELLH
jgi:protein involved in polysaccharide export with SLBB domain